MHIHILRGRHPGVHKARIPTRAGGGHGGHGRCDGHGRMPVGDSKGTGTAAEAAAAAPGGSMTGGAGGGDWPTADARTREAVLKGCIGRGCAGEYSPCQYSLSAQPMGRLYWRVANAHPS